MLHFVAACRFENLIPTLNVIHPILKIRLILCIQNWLQIFSKYPSYDFYARNFLFFIQPFVILIWWAIQYTICGLILYISRRKLWTGGSRTAGESWERPWQPKGGSLESENFFLNFYFRGVPRPYWNSTLIKFLPPLKFLLPFPPFSTFAVTYIL